MTMRAPRAKPEQVRISVVVPTRNEAGNVDVLESQLDMALAGIEYEVVVVDDSNDTITRPALRAAAVRNPHWRVIERAEHDQTGLASAVVAGIDAARGAAVCVMDGDLQHPPEIVPQLLACIERGADLAVASRYMPGGSRAGLDGSIRNLVSRSCTWLAQGIFPEARRTSDPLSGFFCCRSAAIKGLELKPRGFKILLELLVCAPRLRVADVPFAFAARLAGESKASTRQGVLFMGHLVSLFAYVPSGARPLKFAMVTLGSLAVFAGLLYGLFHATNNPMLSWLTATAASGAFNIAVLQLSPFREIARQGEPDGKRLYYAAASVSAVTSFAVFTVLFLPGKHHLFLIAAVGQACGLLLTLIVNQPPVWRRLARMLRLLAMPDIDTLARRLGAQEGFWITDQGEGVDPRLELIGGVVTREMVATASRYRQPALFIERRSARPQARLNIDSSSAIVVPSLDESGEVSAVAVFVRRSRNPFESRHLDEAITWMSLHGGLSAVQAESQGVVA
jgi:dolichol-phosphate mannosyltransferase